MRVTPVTESTTQIAMAHLFELELCVLTVLSKVTTTKFVVDDIDKCFVGMLLSHAYETTVLGVVYNYFEVKTITAVEPLLNTITIDSAYTTINENDLIVETLYNTAILPNTVGSTDYLQLYHSALGTYTGKIHITDYDLPIVTEGERATLANSTTHYTGQILYLPMSVFYQGTEFDSKGKSSTIEVSITNVNQLLGSIVLTHKGLKQRNITVKTAYIDEATSEKYSLAVPVVADTKTTLVSRTDAYFVPDATLNDLFTSFVYIKAISVVTEFDGSVDSASSDNNNVSLQATVKIDSSESVSLPNRLYSRLRCPFIYKSWRCRFNTSMKLGEGISALYTGLVTVKSDKLFYYFKELEKDENTIIKIEDELLIVDAFSEYPGIRAKSNEEVRQLTPAQKAIEITNGNNYFRLNILSRGYGGTTPALHAYNTVIDILTCKKTEHDCGMHGQDAYFGSFPAIPKNKNYNE